MSKEKLIPELRFPEFKNEGEWEIKTLSGICDITNGKANAQDHVDNGRYPLFDRSEVIKASDEFIFDCEAVIIPGEGMRFIPKYYEGKFNLHQRAYALKDFSCSGQFVYYSMLHRSTLLSQKAVQSTVLSLRLPILQDFPIEIPKKPEEQQKIASCLSSLDELIAAHNDKLDALKDHKKGLLQNLFPQEGETVPKVRFPEFKGEWSLEELGQCLDYLQPTPFLVDNTDYNDEYEIPVLTAGKSFILGYTNEQEGIFNENLPVIIFDDFTTASQFVDFPFKTKSSAMKILLAKNDNDIKFVYESMQTLNYEVGVHKRHWISVFSKLRIAVPKPQEQQKIASCLSALDELIMAQAEKIEQLKMHKKGLMQGLFPKTITN